MRSKPLDILRAVAVLLVLGRHLPPCPAESSVVLNSITTFWHRGGWVGVDLFFVLSGFLISGLLFREHEATGTIDSSRFLVRRGLKIYPAFYVLIATTILTYNATRSQVLSEVFFLQNYYSKGLWPHTWSLAVEEHFYLLLVALFLLLLLLNRANPFRRLPYIFIFVAIACLSLRVYLAATGPYSNYRNLFPTHLRIDSLFCGVTVSYLYSRWKVGHRALLFSLGVAGLLPAFVFDIESTPFIYTFGLSLFYLSSAAILISVINLAPTGFASRAVAYIGSRSYSIYLWHLPVAAWASPLHQTGWAAYALVFLGGSVVTGVVLAALIEIPILKLRDRLYPAQRNLPRRPVAAVIPN